MIEITYDDSNRILRVKGHAGYAPIGSDIVCAGVSALEMALIRHCDIDNQSNEFEDILVGGVSARPYMRFVMDGFTAIAEEYPENVTVLCGRIDI